ncbi:hypothetical protein DIE06_02260 [Burkholderia sp. Bp8998]|nr:hypothetical protein DIE06_02260 [Burkholderia sp. Bp8998]
MCKWGSSWALRDACGGRSGRAGGRERPFAPRRPTVRRIRCAPPAIRRDRLRACPKSTRIAQFGFR